MPIENKGPGGVSNNYGVRSTSQPTLIEQAGVTKPIYDGFTPENESPVAFNADTSTLSANDNTLLTFQNTGTEEIPVYELNASVLPRTGTLAELSALTSGGGELCYPVDSEAIVQLRGISPNGTTVVFGSVPVGLWDTASEWIQNPDGVTNLVVTGRDSSQNSGVSGSVTVSGGYGEGVAGGSVTIQGGGATDGGNGGNILLQSGDTDFGGNSGNISIIGTWNPGGAGGGNITLKPAAYGELRLRNGSDVDVVRITGSTGALGFFNSAGTTKPTVSGSRGGNAALTSLLTALANMGLITNSTSA